MAGPIAPNVAPSRRLDPRGRPAEDDGRAACRARRSLCVDRRVLRSGLDVGSTLSSSTNELRFVPVAVTVSHSLSDHRRQHPPPSSFGHVCACSMSGAPRRLTVRPRSEQLGGAAIREEAALDGARGCLLSDASRVDISSTPPNEPRRSRGARHQTSAEQASRRAEAALEETPRPSLAVSTAAGVAIAVYLHRSPSDRLPTPHPCLPLSR